MNVALLIVVGLAFLAAGGEILLRGATRLATLLGVSPLMIGLTVVAFGTSAPELIVSAFAAARGAAEVALGNVLGSTTFNILGILGLTALVAPLTVASRLIRLDVPLMTFAAVLAFVVAMDGRITRLDGVYLAAGLAGYLAFCIVAVRRGDAPAVEQEFARGVERRARGVRQVATASAWVVVGLAALVLGSRWLVEGAVIAARSLGVSELVIGLTIVSVGTSLPEIAASLAAALRGERDLAVGNIVGSNLFNLLGVLGISSLVARGAIPVRPDVLHFDFAVMLAACLACLPVFIMGYHITRIEGAALLAYYAVYVWLIVLRARGAAGAEVLMHALTSYVLPVTLLAGGAAFVLTARKLVRFK